MFNKEDITGEVQNDKFRNGQEQVPGWDMSDRMIPWYFLKLDLAFRSSVKLDLKKRSSFLSSTC